MTTSLSRTTSAAEAARAHHFVSQGLNPDGTPIQVSTDQVSIQSVTVPLDQEVDPITVQPAVPATNGVDSQNEVEILRAELAKLQRDHNSVIGRLTPTQHELEVTRRTLTDAQALQAQREAETQQRIAELQAQLEEQRMKSFNPRELLSEEEASMFDEHQLAAMTKVAQAIAAREATRVQQNQEKVIEKVNANWQEQNRRDKIANTLANPQFGLDWIQSKAEDPAFNEWLTSDEGLVANQMLTNMLNAKSEDIHRFARIASKELGKFPGHPSKTQTSSSAPTGGDLPNRLAAHVTRNSSISALNDQQIQEKIAEANELSARGGTANLAKAKAILDGLATAYARPRS